MAIADLLARLIGEVRAERPGRTPLIGLAGAQGSGKSFHCRAFATAHPRVAPFSLDDVYHSHAEREARARDYCEIYVKHFSPRFASPILAERERAASAFYPLLVTRGPPGTHDLGLATGLIARLGQALPTQLPRFNKLTDDRVPEDEWPLFQGPAEAILIDGWCLGALPPENSPPINDVERGDSNNLWRDEVQMQLSTSYAPFFAAFDAIIYLQAPSWEIVRVWRGEQERETLGRALARDEEARLDRFIQHYERVTRSMLAGHHRAEWIVHLDEERNVVRVERRG